MGKYRNTVCRINLISSHAVTICTVRYCDANGYNKIIQSEQEYIITRVSNLQYPRRNIVYKVTWLPVYCTWASGPDCRGSTRLAVSNLGYIWYLYIWYSMSAVFQEWFLDPFQRCDCCWWRLRLTTPLLNTYKSSKVRIHLWHFFTCSTPEVTLLCAQCFYAGIWRLDTCYYVLLVRLNNFIIPICITITYGTDRNSMTWN